MIHFQVSNIKTVPLKRESNVYRKPYYLNGMTPARLEYHYKNKLSINIESLLDSI